MDVRARHWAVAMLCAVLLHCTALIAFWEPSNAGTPAAGSGGIEVSLGPAGAASGAMVAATDVAEVAPITPATAEPATPQEVVAEPVEAVTEASPVTPEPVMDVEPIEPVTPIEPEPVVPEVEPAEVMEPAEPLQLAELVPPPEPEQVPPPEQEVTEVVPLPEVPPQKPEPPEPVAQAPEPSALPEPPAAEVAEVPAPLQSAALPGLAGQGGSTEFTDQGSANATPGGGQPGGPGTYNAELSAWLQVHHEFPERAQRRKMYGETRVSFTIDRGGNLLSYEIVDSSGYKMLDEAALDTLKRASPMPPMPPELAGSTYNPTITLQFTPPH
jgi:protein TonB